MAGFLSERFYLSNMQDREGGGSRRICIKLRDADPDPVGSVRFYGNHKNKDPDLGSDLVFRLMLKNISKRIIFFN